MTIPPVSVRLVRPCDECVFADWEYETCKLFNHFLQSPICEYNFTQKEMREILDQHNATENTVENYK